MVKKKQPTFTSIGKKAVTLNLLWSPVVLATIEQLDVNNIQMGIAVATSRQLIMQSQDCGPREWDQCVNQVQ